MVLEIKEKTYIALNNTGKFIEKPRTKDFTVGEYLYFKQNKKNENLRVSIKANPK